MALCNLSFPDDDEYAAITVDDKEMAKTAAKLGVKLVVRAKEFCYL